MNQFVNDEGAGNYALGLDLGGSCVKAVAVTMTGTALGRWQEPFDPAHPRYFADITRALAQRIEQERGQPPQRIGLSTPGLPAADGRSIAFMPGRLAGLEGLDWGAFLGRTKPVPVLNDTLRHCSAKPGRALPWARAT